jgi:hypothetical protein
VPLCWIQVAMPICGWYIFPGVSFPPYPHALPVAAAAGPNVGAAPSEADALVPAVIKFVNGGPATQQASVAEGLRLERFDWSGSMRTAEAAGPLGEEVARSAVACALSTLRRYNHGGGDDVHILRGGGVTQNIRVVAARDIKKGELRIAPHVIHPMRITKQCPQGWAPNVVVHRGGENMTMYLTAAGAFPGVVSGPAPAVAESGASRFGDHEWTADALPSPFWAIKMGGTAEGSNCGLEDITINTVRTSSADESAVYACDVVVQVIANHCDISKGTELIARWPSRTATPKRKEPKCTASTWAHQEAKKKKL